MKKIDCILCHPRSKLYLYHRFVLSKVSWHFTIANLSKTWVVENVDHLVSSYVRQWLELPISSTLSTLVVPNTKCGLGFTLPSTKFMLCHSYTKCPQIISKQRHQFTLSPDQLWLQYSIRSVPKYKTSLKYHTKG